MSGALQPGTLLVAAASSVGVAYLMPHLWAPGTLPAAATAPILSTLLAEALRAPVKVAKKATTTRRAYEPLPLEPEVHETNLFELIDGRKDLSHLHVAAAIGAGLLAFAVAALLVTGVDFATGKSPTRSGAQTTLFGVKHDPTPTPTTTPTPSPTGTPTPSPTPTATPSPTPTPSPGSSPSPSPTDEAGDATPTASPLASPAPTATPLAPAAPPITPTPEVVAP